MSLKLITHNSSEYRQMVNLRYQILRQPLGMNFSADELDAEENDILLASFDEDELLACCILSTTSEPGTLRLRQMAVPKNMQGRGIGAALLLFAENVGRDKGYKRITMHARDTAIGFYERAGYKIYGESFIEVGIPHHTMEKYI